MKLSVIVPNYRNDDTLPRTLASLRAAAARTAAETEIVRVDDAAGRGLGWARNRGLDRATGDLVFFCDADDTVEPDFFDAPRAEMERTGADFCLFLFRGAKFKRDYDLTGNAAIRAALLPAWIGYGWRDVARALAGGDLAEFRETAGVCRCVFRRSFLERNRIRFNERLPIYEDAPFLCECAIRAERVACLPRELYNYVPGVHGIINSVTGTAEHWRYKREIPRERRRLNELAGGTIGKYFAASQALGRLEFLRHWTRHSKKGQS